MNSLRAIFRSKRTSRSRSDPQLEPPDASTIAAVESENPGVVLRRWRSVPKTPKRRFTNNIKQKTIVGSDLFCSSKKQTVAADNISPSDSMVVATIANNSQDNIFDGEHSLIVLSPTNDAAKPLIKGPFSRHEGSQRDFDFNLLALSYIFEEDQRLVELITIVKEFRRIAQLDRISNTLVEHMTSLVLNLMDASRRIASEDMSKELESLSNTLKDISITSYDFQNEDYEALAQTTISILEEKRDHLKRTYPGIFEPDKMELGRVILNLTLDPSIAVLSVLSAASEMAPVPFLRTAVNFTIGIFKSAQQTRANYDDVNSLGIMAREFVLCLAEACSQPSFVPTETFRASLAGFLRILQSVHKQCESLSQKSLLHRLLFQDLERQQVTDLKFKLQGAIDIFQMETQLLQHNIAFSIKATAEVISNKLDDEIIDRLPHFFNTYPRNYLPGSRDNTIERVTKWIESSSAPFFWLYGSVGIGKSTLAHELVYTLREAGRLATFFFFSRDSSHQSDPLCVIKMMAYELASLHPRTKPIIAQAIRDPQSTHQPLASYVRSFVINPCLEISFQPMTIVLDGLDEYEHAQLFLNALSEIIIPSNVKILITSRPERDIHRVISKLTVEEFCLETVDGPTVARYFERRFLDIDIEPSSAQLSQLVGLAGGFLAWAATVSSFIGNDMNGRPEELLNEILSQGKRSSSEQQLDLLYNTSVTRLFGHQPGKAAEYFKKVFGAMCVIRERLDVSVLRELIEPSGIVEAVMSRLLSLQTGALSTQLNITPVSDHFHLSFLDFIVDPVRCSHDHLLIRPQHAHAMLANKCLSLMANSVQFQSGQVNFLQLGKTVQYAVQSWPLHVTKSAPCGDRIPDEVRLHVEEFLGKYLDVWIGLVLETSGRIEAYNKVLAAPDIPGRLTCLVLELRHFRDNGPFPVAKLLPIQEVAISLAYDSPYLDNYMINLAQMFREQFWEEGTIASLDLAVLFYRRILNLRPYPHTGRSQALNSLGNCLWHRWEKTGSGEDLNEAIALNEEALSLRPSPHPKRAQSLNGLANTLASRFRRDASEEDLDTAIFLHECALDMRPPPNPNRFQSLRNLAATLWTRFEWTCSNNDLNRAILLSREALKLLPSTQMHWLRSHSLMKLANGLCSSGEKGGSKEDIAESIILHRKALQLRIPGHPDRPDSLNGLARALRIGYQQTGSKSDLEEAITLHREAIQLSSASDPLYSHYLTNLSKAIWYQYKQTNSSADLEEAISLNRQAISLQQPARGEPSQIYNNFANALHSRFERTNDMESLNYAISLHYEALKLRPIPSLGRPQSLSNLADLLLCRYGETAQEADLKEALTLNYEALRLLPAHHVRRSYTLNSLGKAVWVQSLNTDSGQELDQAIDSLREALELRPTAHPNRPETLDNLAGALRSKFLNTDAEQYLREATSLLQEAVLLTPQTHIYFDKYNRNLNHAMDLYK